MNTTDWLGYFELARIPELVRRQNRGEFLERRYQVANRILQVHYSSQILSDAVGASIAHLLCTEERAIDLEIFVWERSEFLPEAGEVDGSAVASSGAGDRFLCHHGPGVVSIYEPVRQRAFFWIDTRGGIDVGQQARPFRNILHWFLIRQGVAVLHGAVIADHRGGVLLMGKGGSGKTTTALSCVDGGLSYLGDDFVAVDGQSCVAYSLYASALLTVDCRARLPGVGARVRNPERLDREKGLVLVTELPAGRIRSEAGLRAILLPEISDQAVTTMVPVAKGAAMLRLSPSSIGCLPEFKREQLNVLARVVARLPCYVMKLGGDVRDVAACVKAFLLNHDV